METKWKKGDRVRVRSGLDCEKRYKMLTSNHSAIPSYVMAHFFAGKELTISHASQLGYCTEETGRDFVWTDEMFEEENFIQLAAKFAKEKSEVKEELERLEKSN